MIKPFTRFFLAPFRFDVTPPLRHSLLGGLVLPAKTHGDGLEAIGYVLLGAGEPIVVCALDWAGLMNDAHVAWRRALASAAGTTPDRVAVQCVHPHNTPFVCPEAQALTSRHGDLPAMFDTDFFDICLQRATAAVHAALPRAEVVTHIAHGSAIVDRVASNRRVARDASGRVTAMRRSFCSDPELIALPEGKIDPLLQTLAFYNAEGRKILACSYYATHPMSFYDDGEVSTDFCGLARKRLQAQEPQCTHLYFTGCAGDISAGKYNDGSLAARRVLLDRMHAALVAAQDSLEPEPLTSVDWASESILPPPRQEPAAPALEAALANPDGTLAQRLLPAFQLGWRERVARGEPLCLSRLQLNDTAVLHLPGEMFVEYQLRARALRPGRPVLVAAYGDDGLWYVPTKDEYPAGGYEIDVAFSRDDVDEIMMGAIRRLLA